MSEDGGQCGLYPTARQIRRAVELYLARAYGEDRPETTKRFLPDDGTDIEEWLMSDAVERDPADAPLGAIRSFVLRLGNRQYPHMKLRMSRPPKDRVFLFSVDAHDAFLHAPPGSPDYGPLEALKRHNSQLVAEITCDWEAAGLPTERNYLREKIRHRRDGRRDASADPAG